MKKITLATLRIGAVLSSFAIGQAQASLITQDFQLDPVTTGPSAFDNTKNGIASSGSSNYGPGLNPDLSAFSSIDSAFLSFDIYYSFRSNASASGGNVGIWDGVSSRNTFDVGYFISGTSSGSTALTTVFHGQFDEACQVYNDTRCFGNTFGHSDNGINLFSGAAYNDTNVYHTYTSPSTQTISLTGNMIDDLIVGELALMASAAVTANLTGCNVNTPNCNSYAVLYMSLFNVKVSVTGDDGNSPHATTTVPEPASIALLGLGLVGLGFARRKRKKV